MSDLAANTQHKHRVRGRDSFVIANTEVLYTGALVQLNAGFLADWDDNGAASTFLGYLIDGDQTGNAAGETGFTGDTSGAPAPDPEGRVNTAGEVLQHLAGVQGQGTTTIAIVGDLIYCPDSDVQLFTPAEFLAQQTA